MATNMLFNHQVPLEKVSHMFFSCPTDGQQYENAMNLAKMGDALGYDLMEEEMIPRELLEETEGDEVEQEKVLTGQAEPAATPTILRATGRKMNIELAKQQINKSQRTENGDLNLVTQVLANDKVLTRTSLNHRTDERARVYQKLPEALQNVCWNKFR